MGYQRPHNLEKIDALVDGGLIHYTCNSPSNEVLISRGIKTL